MTAPAPTSITAPGAAIPGMPAASTGLAPAGASSGDFVTPPRSTSPRFLRQLEVIVALAAVLAGVLAGWVILDLRSDLASSPQRTEQYARLGEVNHALLAAGDLAARSTIAGETAGGALAGAAGDQLATAAGLLVDAAQARPGDADQLNQISQEVSRYAQELARARGAERAQALTLLGAADTQLDRTLSLITDLQATLAQEAAGQPVTQNAALVVWPMLALLAVVVWASWALARLSHRVVNLGLVATAVAILLLMATALGAQTSATEAAKVSRTEQFAHVVNLAGTVNGLDRAQRVLTTAVLRHSWGSAQDDAYTTAFAAAQKAASGEKLPSLKGYDTAKQELATQMAKGDWTGAANTLTAADDKSLDVVADNVRQSAATKTEAALAEATSAPEDARGALVVQLVLAIGFALAGAVLGVLGIARRLQEYR
ncbi:MAG: hypothetical protein LCH96_06625 [Actinobacteria bacterium]|nr:hypothetical protein [Actinomycetota bacterium]